VTEPDDDDDDRLFELTIAVLLTHSAAGKAIWALRAHIKKAIQMCVAAVVI